MGAPHERCRRQWWARLGAAACLLALAAPAVGAEAPQDDAGRRAAALELGAEGLALFEQQQYAEALDRFERANEIVPAPTLGIRSARCLTKLGRLVEAAERYVAVIRFPLGDSATPAQVAAIEQARRELDELQRLLPTLTVRVLSVDPEGLTVRVDGEALPPALVGHPQPLDPGVHRVVVRAPELAHDERLSIAPGERLTMVLQAPRRERPVPRTEPNHALRDASVGAFAIGVAGALFGTINGAVAIAQQDALAAQCPERNCPPSAYENADRYDDARRLATTGFVVGGVGLALGAVLLVADLWPAQEEPEPQAPDEQLPWSRRLRPAHARGSGLAWRF